MPCTFCHMSELEARRRLSEAAYRKNTEPEPEEPEEARPFTDEEEAYMLDGAPDHMICPLTCTLVYDPRIASDGFTYQKRAIERFIKGFKARGEKLVSPMTGEPLVDVTIPNHLVRQTVCKYIDQKKRELRTCDMAR